MLADISRSDNLPTKIGVNRSTQQGLTSTSGTPNSLPKARKAKKTCS